ncbi:single-stranded DNA-binding protein [Acrocarpospora sp. B8E8]|uniref:single-stranded DNA-binding protein n=1 Tax=Acrocarpospora sp. B8E8 TaxID=3153572 RepID=UPI00325DA387
MSEIYVTLSGNVTDDPKQFHFGDGSRATSMRVAVNRRFLDRQTQTWQDGETTYYTVRCYRALADHVAQSVRRGHPVVVSGKLRVKQFERGGEQRFWVEVEAVSVGHDLKWGITSFERPVRGSTGPVAAARDLRAMEDATREWELTTVPSNTLRLLEGGAGRPDAEPYLADDVYESAADGLAGGLAGGAAGGFGGGLGGGPGGGLAGDAAGGLADGQVGGLAGGLADGQAGGLAHGQAEGLAGLVEGSVDDGHEVPWPGDAMPLAA